MAEEKIGDFMIRIGAMTPEQVTEVLTLQKQHPDKLFGVIAIEKGYINDKALHEYIKKDQS